MQRTDNQWTVETTGGIPKQGKYSRARQKAMWGDEMKRFAGIRWDQLAQDRAESKPLGEPFVLRWTRLMMMMEKQGESCKVK